MQDAWGISADSLLYRCREVGLFSDSTATRACQQLHALRRDRVLTPQPIAGFPGEQPILLQQAFDLASCHGLTLPARAEQLAWPLPRVRELLGFHDHRPTVRLV
ncbi:hypothetical protein [Micromonospora sp. NPDC005173]|uniref:hypothetical protein n=1 Tax=Micromonospora sp. NPDC005173 TaxID=3157165 RepID=UPI0033AC2F79